MSVSRRSLVRSFTAFLILSAAAGCSDPSPSSPADPSTRNPRQLVRETRTRNGIPAIAAALVTPSGSAQISEGIRRLGFADSITAADRFHIGSLVKSMTATLAASVVDSGLIGWDSRIVAVLPELSDVRPEYAAVTLDDLLRHRSGIMAATDPSDLASMPPLQGTLVEQRRQFARWVLTQPPIVAPRTKSEYSNAGYVVAATMLEKVTGRSYEDLLTARVLAPLGIQPVFDWPARGGAAQPWGHEAYGASLTPSDPDAPDNEYPAFANPAGNLSLPLAGYVRYMQVHLNALQGRPTLVSAAGFSRVQTLVDGYGLGWLAGESHGKPVLGHNGSAGTFYAFVILQADGAGGVVVMANADSETIRNGVLELILALHGTM
jgi:CubicO group peptidase (beta-lactamase class C family)